MISKLPRWIWSGAWVLAFVAGIVNVVALVGFEHHGISHLTGSTSLLADALSSGEAAAAVHFALLIGAFVAGCVISGFVIQDTVLQLGRRYGIALILESVLLFLSVPLLRANLPAGIYCAACACGLQNAMVSTYSGAVVRTTHLSGMFTDLGIFLGHFLRGIPVDLRRLRLCLIVISGFLAGGVVGASGFRELGYATLYIPAVMAALAAAAYAWLRLRARRLARSDDIP